MAAFVAVALVAATAGSGRVSAHAELLSVEPADGATVESSPDEVVLTFSERVSLAGGSARVLSDDGETVSGDPAVVDTTVRIPIEGALAVGTYTVSYQLISADSHRVGGATIFNVGEASSGAVYEDVASGRGGVAWPIDASTSALVAIEYGAALMAAGLWFFGIVLGRFRPDDQVADRWRAWVAGSAVVGAVSACAVVPGRLLRAGGGVDALRDDEFVSSLLRGPIGQSTAVVATCLLVVGVVVSARPSVLVSPSRWLIGIVSLGAFVGFALDGHSRALRPAVMIPADVVHGAAAAWWLGGVAGLVILVGRDPGGVHMSRIVKQYSKVAVIAVGVVSALGVLMGWVVLPDVAALGGTRYGITLLVKASLVVVVIGIAAFNHFVVVPRLPDDSAVSTDAGRTVWSVLAATVRIEAVLLLIVVGATAILASQSPNEASAAPGSTDGNSGGEPIALALSQGAGEVYLDRVPTRTGSVQIELLVMDADGTVIQSDVSPEVTITNEGAHVGPLELTAHLIRAGTYHLIGQVPLTGTWRLDVRVRVSDFVSATASTTFVAGE